MWIPAWKAMMCGGKMYLLSSYLDCFLLNLNGEGYHSLWYPSFGVQRGWEKICKIRELGNHQQILQRNWKLQLEMEVDLQALEAGCGDRWVTEMRCAAWTEVLPVALPQLSLHVSSAGPDHCCSAALQEHVCTFPSLTFLLFKKKKKSFVLPFFFFYHGLTKLQIMTNKWARLLAQANKI